MRFFWLPETREWAVTVPDDAARYGRAEVARFSTLAQAEEWWLAEGHNLYERDAS